MSRFTKHSGIRGSAGLKQTVIDGEHERHGRISQAPYRNEINYRAALEAACDRVEKAKGFKAQHGPVRIIMQDGKPVDRVRDVAEMALDVAANGVRDAADGFFRGKMLCSVGGETRWRGRDPPPAGCRKT